VIGCDETEMLPYDDVYGITRWFDVVSCWSDYEDFFHTDEWIEGKTGSPQMLRTVLCISD
jgi:hypothetical protein